MKKTTWVPTVLITTGLLAAACPLAAQPQALTLERAIEIAVDGNRELKAADARLEAAAAVAEEARAERLPRLDLAAQIQATDNPVLVFSNLLGQANFQQQNFALDELNQPDPLNNWKTRLAVTQPLWTAGRIRHAVGAAELAHDAAGSEREARRQRVVHRVIEAYTAAVLAGRELEVTRQSLETAGAHVKLVSDLRRGGLVVESDVLQAEVRESEVRELVIRAESGVEITRAALNLALGRDLATPVVLPQDLELEPRAGGAASDPAALVARALDRRPDLAAARRLTAAAGRRLDLERAARRPVVGLEGSWEANAEDFFGADGDNWTLAVGFEVNLFDGHRRRSRARRADAERREAAERAALLAESIGLEVRRVASELRAAEARREQAELSVALAERSHGIVEDRYREGLTVLTELLDAETALTRARLRQLAAGRDVLLARATLDLATGDL